MNKNKIEAEICFGGDQNLIFDRCNTLASQ